MKHFYKYALFMTLAAFVFSCTNDELSPIEEQTEAPLNIVGKIEAEQLFVETQETENARTSGYTETFESGYKSSYAGGSVSFSSGSYYLSDALTGTLSSDRKYSYQSVRIRNTGYLMMNFNMDNGASTVKVRHAKYGSDGSSSWSLIVSYDNGANWYYVGNSVTTSSTSLQTVTFNVNVTSSARFAITKTSGGSNRINIDNFEVIAGTSGGSSASASRDNNMTFGNPSDANLVTTNYLVSRTEYALAYDNNRGTADWVSWHLSSAWIGSASRSDNFRQDPYLPSGFYSPGYSDYTNSGFDRGHLCPSADRTYTSTANSNTFYMTNIAPQAPKNNQQTWRYLEDYCRELVSQGNELHIIAGVAGTGGSGRYGYSSTIDGGNITVPQTFWKAILVLPNGSSDVSRVSTATRVIAVAIPNNESISTSWASYRTTVDYIESITGLNLFENISNTTENYIESRVDDGPTY
jgi:endonuclease G, mitochondrial